MKIYTFLLNFFIFWYYNNFLLKNDTSGVMIMVQDMTEGKPLKMILSFSIPLLIGNLFQQLYNMADSVIVGRMVGMNALAALGATGAIFF